MYFLTVPRGWKNEIKVPVWQVSCTLPGRKAVTHGGRKDVFVGGRKRGKRGERKGEGGTERNLSGIFYVVFVLFCSVLPLGPHPQHMEVLRLGVKSELQLLACATATATPSEPRLQPTPQLTATPDP